MPWLVLFLALLSTPALGQTAEWVVIAQGGESLEQICQEVRAPDDPFSVADCVAYARYESPNLGDPERLAAGTRVHVPYEKVVEPATRRQAASHQWIAPAAALACLALAIALNLRRAFRRNGAPKPPAP